MRRLLTTAEQEILKGLEPYGYYNAQVASSLETTDKGLTALFRVTPGEPVKVASKNVKVNGDAAQLGPVRRAVRRFKPDEGEVLNHGTYEQSKEDVESALLNNGFLRMKSTQKRVEVSRKANTAAIDLEWESGPRMKFGNVRFSEAQFPPEFLERYIPGNRISYYSPDELVAFQQRLVDADYFATVSVLPDLEHAEGLNVPINVELSPAKRTIYTAGRLRKHRHRSRREARHAAALGKRFGAQVPGRHRLRPATVGVLDELSHPSAGPQRQEPELRRDASGRKHRHQSVEERPCRHQRDSQVARVDAHAGFCNISPAPSRSPTRGATRTCCMARPPSRARKRETSFSSPRLVAWVSPRGLLLRACSRTRASVSSRRMGNTSCPPGGQQRLITRLSLGAMVVDDFNQLPPELRFFAGGDRSIRGFDYQQLGTTNAAGLVIGGEYLAVGKHRIRALLPAEVGCRDFCGRRRRVSRRRVRHEHRRGHRRALAIACRRRASGRREAGVRQCRRRFDSLPRDHRAGPVSEREETFDEPTRAEPGSAERSRWWLWTILGVVAFFALLFGGAMWVINTESGTRWAANRAVGFLGGKLEIREVTGTLAGPLTVSGVRWNDPDSGADVRVARATVDAALMELLSRRVHVLLANINGVGVRLSEPRKKDEEKKPFSLEPPIDLLLDSFTLKDARISKDGQELFVIRAADAGARWTKRDGIVVQKLAVDSPDGNVHLTAQVADSGAASGDARSTAVGAAGGDSASFDSDAAIAELSKYTARVTGGFRWKVADAQYAGDVTATNGQQKLTAQVRLSEPFSARLDATVNESSGLPWQLKLAVPQFDPRDGLLPDSSIQSLATTLDAHGDLTFAELRGDVAMNGQSLAHRPGTHPLQGAGAHASRPSRCSIPLAAAR